MGEIRVLSSGVDTLHLTVRGTVRDEVWAELDAARSGATPDEPEVVELGDTGQALKTVVGQPTASSNLAPSATA